LVTDAAGSHYPCPDILGVDTVNDLALLKCETGLSSVRLGDSDKVAIGDQVVAIGNPRGLQGTSRMASSAAYGSWKEGATSRQPRPCRRGAAAAAYSRWTVHWWA
jgi:S1-C subfamily serine protease